MKTDKHLNFIFNYIYSQNEYMTKNINIKKKKNRYTMPHYVRIWENNLWMNIQFLRTVLLECFR